MDSVNCMKVQLQQKKLENNKDPRSKEANSFIHFGNLAR